MSGEKRMRASIGSDGTIELAVPGWPVGHDVDVTVRLVDRQPRRSIQEVLQASPGGLLFKTAAEVDSYIDAERASWGA